MTPTPRLAGITILGTLAYLGLAIFGWGGFAAFFSHPARIALAITLFVLAGVALFSGGNLSPGEREDRANRWVLVAFTLIGLLAGYLPAYTDRTGVWTLDGDPMRWLGVGLLYGERIPPAHRGEVASASNPRLLGEVFAQRPRSNPRGQAG